MGGSWRERSRGRERKLVGWMKADDKDEEV